jgi:SAM-dependent methyltransferase
MALRFSEYDARNYPTVDVLEGYRRWAARYDEMMSGDIDLRLLDSLEQVVWTVARAVDLACGTGRIGSYLASKGAARIEGVDLSPEMLERARQRGVYASLECADICRTSLPSGCADLVVNVLAIEHLPSLAPFYAECARLIAPAAQLVVLGYHPHFLLNGIPTHFRELDGTDLAIENHVHLFSDHVSAARACGFELVESRELVVDAEMIARLRTWQRHQGKPASFALVWRLRPELGAAVAVTP